MIWKSSLVTLAMTMVVWMLVLSTTTAEATEDETLSKKQLTEMLGQYKPAFKTVIKRMTQYLDRKRAKNGLERRGEEVTADDMKRGIQSTFGAAWVKDNVKSIKKVMSAKINEHHKELRKRSQEGSLSEKEKAQIAKDAPKAVEKKLRDEFKTTGKEQLQLFVDLANEQQKPKGAVFK